MNDHNQDPFAKYDKLFEDQAKDAEKTIAKNDPKQKRTFKQIEQSNPRPRGGSSAKNNPVKVILIVVFSILAFQAIPFLAMDSAGLSIHPMFLTIFIIVFVNIIIKAFKR